jgi:hypothetical protein
MALVLCLVWFMTLLSSAPLSLDTVTKEARNEWAVYPLPKYCWVIRLMVDVLRRHPPRGELLVLAQGHKHAAFSPVEYPQPGLERANGAQGWGIKDGFLFRLPELVGFTLVERHD